MIHSEDMSEGRIFLAYFLKSYKNVSYDFK